MKKEQFEILMYALYGNNQLFIPQGQTIQEWIDNAFDNAIKQEQLLLHNVSNSFIAVSEKEPPKHKELLVQSPDGQNYLASWREAYSIFTCQNKGEDSLDWKWKEI